MIDNLKVACCLLVCGFVCIQPIGARLPSYCFLPPDPSWCRSKPESLWDNKYFYNFLTGKCEAFHFEGCSRRANKNKFDTIAECKRSCQEVRKV
ncbi:hypothetical protein BsWGS_21406 [Bradybaena similaris]